MRSCWRTHCWFGIWSKLEKWKSSISGCLINWLQIKKIIILKCHLLLFYTTMNHFLIVLWCVMKSGLYYNWWQPAQWLGQEEAPKHFLKPNLHKRKVMVTVWWSAAGLIHYSFLNPSEPVISEIYAQQIDEMHWKLQRLQLALVNRMGPIFLQITAHYMLQTNASKVEWKKKKVEWAGLWSFASSAIFLWPLANRLPLLQVFWQFFIGKTFPQAAGGRKCKEFGHGFLCYGN